MIDAAAHYGRAFGVWMDTISHISAKEFGERYNRSRWGTFFTLFEPIALISIIFVGQYALTGIPPWKDALYHTTGILPYYLFLHISQRVRALDLLRLLPRVSRFDVIVSRLITEIITKTLVFILMMIFFWWVGVQPVFPSDVMTCLEAVMLLSMVGLGVGFFNGSISAIFPAWMYIYAILARALLLASGIMYRPDSLPVHLRSVTEYNPLFQGIYLFRSGFYPSFPTFLLNIEFLYFSSLAIFAFGMLLDYYSSEWRTTYH